MNGTKKKILEKSLQLFNTHGIADVSLRTIADEIEISIGNLQYHFKKREDIVETLYFQIVDSIDTIIINMEADLLESFFIISRKMIEILYEYRFFFLDFVTITRRNQTIKKHYTELSKRRETEFLTIVAFFTQHGIFKKEALQNEYKNLFKRVELLSNFWFSSVLIQQNTLSEKCIEEYILTVSQCIYPYLTEQSKNRYAILFPSQLL